MISSPDTLIGAVKCHVEVDLISGGKKLSRRTAGLSVVISREVNRIPTARIILLDGDPCKNGFGQSDSEDFKPGKELQILAGSPAVKVPVFKGIIIKQKIEVDPSGASMLVVECKDNAYELTVGRKSRYFYDQTDSAIIADLLDEAGLPGDTGATKVKHETLVQYNCSDWDFIVMRAEANGHLVIADDGVLRLVKPVVEAPEKPVKLENGRNLFDFDAELDSRSQYKTVITRSWDVANQKIQEDEGEIEGLEAQGNLSSDELSQVNELDALVLKHSGYLKESELKSWAEAQALKSKLARIRGRFKMEGNISVAPGTVVELSEVGERFNGRAFVSAVRHEIAGGSWHVDVQFGMDEKWFAEKVNTTELPAGGLTPAIHGLQIGVVNKLEGDPANEHRIQVRMPTILPEGDGGVWARIGTLDAGKDRGTVFRPELGDEVILGFLSDDPRHPVILGMMHSSAMPPPIPAADKNPQKGIVSRGKMQLLFDDEKNILTISTPKGNQLVLNEDEGSLSLADQNGNSIILDSNGIKIESAGDIILKAKQKVQIEATDFKASSTKTFKATSNSTMELSGSTTTIKGQPIHLNP